MKKPISTAPIASTTPNALGRFAAPLALLVLAACGGGGSSSDAPAAAPAGVAGSASGASAGASSPGVSSPVAGSSSTTSTCGIPDFAAVALARINQARAAGANCGSGNLAPAAALTWSPLLGQAAEAHTQDMVAKNFFSHTGSSGSSMSSRVTATGYAWSNLGENIAAGYAGIDKVMDGWLASPGHCANLLNLAFTQVALVCVPGNSTTNYNNYWTMDLARSR